MVQYNKLFYIFGGIDHDKRTVWNNMWILNPERETFRHKRTLNDTLARWQHTAILINSNMVVFGGINTFGQRMRDLSCYSFMTNDWEEHDDVKEDVPSPTARNGHSAVSYEQAMYVFGGITNESMVRELWKWDFRDGWTLLPTRNGPRERNGHGAIVFDKKMFIFAGESLDKKKSMMLLSDLWYYDFETSIWKQIHVLNTVTPRMNPVLFEFQGFLHGFGGNTRSKQKTVKDQLLIFEFDGKRKIDETEEERQEEEALLTLPQPVKTEVIREDGTHVKRETRMKPTFKQESGVITIRDSPKPVKSEIVVIDSPTNPPIPKRVPVKREKSAKRAKLEIPPDLNCITIEDE
jgi:N-acetylneuraminic acid mutarotase